MDYNSTVEAEKKQSANLFRISFKIKIQLAIIKDDDSQDFNRPTQR